MINREQANTTPQNMGMQARNIAQQAVNKMDQGLTSGKVRSQLDKIPKPQSLQDVKGILSTAFHKG